MPRASPLTARELTAQVRSRRHLHFDDGAPVRAASGLARLGDGFLIAQDDAVDAALWGRTSVQRLRLLPPVEGHVVFGPADGTKHLKPDLEAALPVVTGTGPGVLVLGSGSLPARMRGVLVTSSGGTVVSATLSGLYEQVAAVLQVPLTDLNLEAACQVDDVVRWFLRGSTARGLADASVDVELAALLAVFTDERDAASVPVTAPRRYDLGAVDGVGLAVTDAVALPDGRLLLSAAAEDTPNAVDDGPVVGSALVLVADHEVQGVAPLPRVDGAVPKVEGLALVEQGDGWLDLLAVVDEDRELAPSAALELRLSGV